jgi:hypothetical protein
MSMSAFLKKLRKAEKEGKRILHGGNSAYGLEYNGIIDVRRVCREIFDFDIARNPHVVRGFATRVNVHNKAWKANRYNQLIHYKTDHAGKSDGGWF